MKLPSNIVSASSMTRCDRSERNTSPEVNFGKGLLVRESYEHNTVVRITIYYLSPGT